MAIKMICDICGREVAAEIVQHPPVEDALVAMVPRDWLLIKLRGPQPENVVPRSVISPAAMAKTEPVELVSLVCSAGCAPRALRTAQDFILANPEIFAQGDK